DAEAAITELRNAGFPLNQVSLIAKDADGNNPVGGVNTQPGVGNKAGEGVKAGALTGGALGGLGGLLVGLGALAIPGVGPVIAGGALATALATAATGGAIGAAAGGLTGGLAGLGIPENRARAYSDRFNRGDYLVLVDGTNEQLRHAEAILKRHNIQDFDIFDAGRDGVRQETPVVNTTSTNYSTGVNREEPAVIIIDNRDERV
ncbi:MAG: histidine kinase, partial [Stigonema ocellatum SAG 48.90 = DSM 106950]|nr:histidine kinase [Stigonema ocellatum SAG 48.90 = DSM 106950]